MIRNYIPIEKKKNLRVGYFPLYLSMREGVIFMEKTILVVDDEAHIQELIKFNLIKNGFKVITADNGIDALKIAEDEKPDLIFLDLMLPGMDGLEVCKSIRKNSSLKLHQ